MRLGSIPRALAGDRVLVSPPHPLSLELIVVFMFVVVARVVVVVEVDVVGERKDRPVPQWREGARSGLRSCGLLCHGEEEGVGSGVLVVEPTSLNRGEGLVVGFLCVVEREGGVFRREDGGGGMREDEPNVNGDAVDVRFKLRSPSKITFDVNAEYFDKEIKTWIMLLVS